RVRERCNNRPASRGAPAGTCARYRESGGIRSQCARQHSNDVVDQRVARCLRRNVRPLHGHAASPASRGVPGQQGECIASGSCIVSHDVVGVVSRSAAGVEETGYVRSWLLSSADNEWICPTEEHNAGGTEHTATARVIGMGARAIPLFHVHVVGGRASVASQQCLRVLCPHCPTLNHTV